MSTASEQRHHWDERYRTGPTPWDTEVTPPEVKAFWASGRLPPTGLALDVGCGTGTNSVYLARLGLWVIGLELAGIALGRAQMRRNRQPSSLARRIAFVQSDVSHPPLRQASAVYVLDIGCFHALSSQSRIDYTKNLLANLKPGGYYHLFAFDRAPEERGDSNARGLEKDEVAQRFTPDLQVVEIQQGRPDRRPCRWYLLCKPPVAHDD